MKKTKNNLLAHGNHLIKDSVDDTTRKNPSSATRDSFLSFPTSLS
jgi:hypothetical protein